MKTYYIDKIGCQNVNIKAESVSELISVAIKHAESNGGYIARVYVHCSHILTDGKKWSDEQNVEYEVRVNNNTKKITAKRI